MFHLSVSNDRWLNESIIFYNKLKKKKKVIFNRLVHQSNKI